MRPMQVMAQTHSQNEWKVCESEGIAKTFKSIPILEL
jgi:hypothetical protein